MQPSSQASGRGSPWNWPARRGHAPPGTSTGLGGKPGAGKQGPSIFPPEGAPGGWQPYQPVRSSPGPGCPSRVALPNQGLGFGLMSCSVYGVPVGTGLGSQLSTDTHHVAPNPEVGKVVFNPRPGPPGSTSPHPGGLWVGAPFSAQPAAAGGGPWVSPKCARASVSPGLWGLPILVSPGRG